MSTTDLEKAHLDGLAADNLRLANENKELRDKLDRLKAQLATQERVSNYWREQALGGES